MRSVLGEIPGSEDSKPRRALAFIDKLHPETRRAAIHSHLLFALALNSGWLDIAREIWDLGLELRGFSEDERRVPPQSLVLILSIEAGDESVGLGARCLAAAAVWNATVLLEGLLELGVRPIPPSPC